MRTAGQLSVATPATVGALPAVRSALRGWLSASGVDEDTASDVVTAVWEACANAVEHPLAPTSDELVVEAGQGPGCLWVSVRDSGSWRTHGRTSTRGFGLPLVSGLMDDVVIDRRPGGTVVRMVRKLEPRDSATTVLSAKRG